MTKGEIVDAGADHEILSARSFRDRKAGDGVIVIAEWTRLPPKAHAPECDYVRETWFAQKVLENGRKEGRYYFFADLQTARRVLGAAPCGHCVASP